MDNFMQEHHLVNVGNSNFVASAADIFNGDPATDVVNMKDWNRATFVIQKTAGIVGTATITIESCDDMVPTTTTAIPFKYRKATSGDTFGEWTDATASGFTTTAGADQIYEISVTSSDLNGTDHYVRLQTAVSVVGAVGGGIVAILTEPRYAKSIPDTVLT